VPRALITGICGFAGRYLANHLHAQNFDCAGIALSSAREGFPPLPPSVRIFQADVRDRAAIRRILATEAPDYVFHLAAVTHVAASLADPELAFDVNVNGTFNILEGLRQSRPSARVVLVSSGNLYGNLDSAETGFSEQSPVHATSPYATSKIVAEQLARSFVEDFGLLIVIARPFNHTGPGQSTDFACPSFARSIAAAIVEGRPASLTTGALQPERDLSDVRDVVRAYALLARSGVPGRVYNVCSGNSISMEQVIRTLAQLAQIPVATRIDPSRLREREVMRLVGDCSRLRRELGWTPEYPLARTLQDLLAFWVEQLQHQRQAG
jgi:GDP-4-dehydro-6-deoxy-D-mannose reductase